MDQLRHYGSLTALAAYAITLAVTMVSCGDTTDAEKESATVIVTNLAAPGAFEVENRGPSMALSSQVTVQRLENGVWQDRATDLVLSDQCASNQSPACRTLEHGAKLRPVPWDGEVCSGQCMLGCRGNDFLGPGQVRFVVAACDRKQRFYGPAFTLPDYDHSELKKKRAEGR